MKQPAGKSPMHVRGLLPPGSLTPGLAWLRHAAGPAGAGATDLWWHGACTDGGMVLSTSQDPETHVVIGGGMKVHRVMGCGFAEPVYHAALKIELRRLGVPFASEVSFPLHYDGEPLKLCYRADLVCFETLIVEIKALSGIGPLEEAQAINYLKASRLRRALIVNFGARSLQWRRLVL